MYGAIEELNANKSSNEDDFFNIPTANMNGSRVKKAKCHLSERVSE